MPKITETRFKYIVKNIYPPAGISRGVDNFIKELINHPEIKSLFECEPTECKFCGSSNTVVNPVVKKLLTTRLRLMRWLSMSQINY